MEVPSLERQGTLLGRGVMSRPRADLSVFLLLCVGVCLWLFTLTMCFCVIVVPVSALLFHYYFVIGHYHLLCIMLITPSLFSLLSCAVCCQIVVLCSFMSQLQPQLMFCLHRDRASFVFIL